MPRHDARAESTKKEMNIMETTTNTTMPGLEQGIVKFTRKPAKMGADRIIWIPRVYLKNGLVDPTCEYEVYLRKKQK
jgi:hypothetical protein